MRTRNCTKEIARLREMGYDVRIQHFRLFGPEHTALTRYQAEEMGLTMQQAHTTGGYTRVLILHDEVIYGRGDAVCRPDESFNKHFGLQVALGRAMKAANLLPRQVAA